MIFNDSWKKYILSKTRPIIIQAFNASYKRHPSPPPSIRLSL